MKNALIILLIIISAVLLYLLVNNNFSITSNSKFDRSLLIGQWDGDYYLNFNTDSSFNMYCSGSKQNLIGKWEVSTVIFNGKDTTVYLVLVNERPKQYRNEDYFKNYFFEIKKLTNHSLTIEDLSASLTIRRNHIYKLKKELE